MPCGPAKIHPAWRTEDGESADRTVSFGSGPHYCLGALLASMQIRVALEEPGSVSAGYEAGTRGGQRSHWPDVRGWTSLPARVTPRTRDAGGV